MAMDPKFRTGCEIIYEKCMGLKEGERVLILTDDEKLPLGTALYETAKDLGAKPVLMQIPVCGVSGQEPPAAVAAAMMEADVVIAPTCDSITHTNARINAAKNGARIATMPGITETMFSEGPIKADYREVARITEVYTRLLTKTNHVRVCTLGGHELHLDITGRAGVPSKGVYLNPGESGNLPSGEAYTAPLEGTTNGTYCIGNIVLDGEMTTDPIVFTIENGRITKIEGKNAAKVEAMIPEHELSRSVGELGIGTNPMAKLTGVILEDEKIYASVHVAFGTNTSFGGVIKAPSHIDFVTLEPTVYFDDVKVIEGGRLLVNE